MGTLTTEKKSDLQLTTHPLLLDDPNYLARLADDPAHIVHCIIVSYADRVEGSIDPKLSREFYLLQRALKNPRKLPDGAWNTLMKQEELPRLYFALITGPGFVEGDPIFMAALLEGLANVAEGALEMHDIETIKNVLAYGLSGLFECLWKNRELLQLIVPGTHTLDSKSHPAMRLMASFCELFRRGSSSSSFADLKTYVPQIALFGWVCLGDTAHSLTGLWFLTDRANRRSETMLDEFLGETLEEIGGAEAVFARFEQTLDDESKEAQPKDALCVMHELLKHPSLRRSFSQRETTCRHIISLLNRRAHSGKMNAEEHEAACMEWVMAYSIFKIVVEALNEAIEKEDATGFAVHGEDLFSCLARGIGWIARSASQPGVRNVLLGTAKAAELTEALVIVGMWVSTRYWTNLAPTFADGVDRGMRAEWLPTLDSLRAGKARLRGSNKDYDAFCQLWAGIGTGVGLDEGRERKRLQKLCSYWLCPFSREPPPGALSACTGCLEARYCGSNCQRRDWKFHKLMCGTRLK